LQGICPSTCWCCVLPSPADLLSSPPISSPSSTSSILSPYLLWLSVQHSQAYQIPKHLNLWLELHKINSLLVQVHQMGYSSSKNCSNILRFWTVLAVAPWDDGLILCNKYILYRSMWSLKRMQYHVIWIDSCSDIKSIK
jgi:hypothetical protein